MRSLQIDPEKEPVYSITEEQAKKMFDWNCERIKKEYQGQPLGIIRFGKWCDLVYRKDSGAVGYLTTCPAWTGG